MLTTETKLWGIYLGRPSQHLVAFQVRFRQYRLASGQEIGGGCSRVGGVLWPMEGLSFVEILHPFASGFPGRRPPPEPLRSLPGPVGRVQRLVRLGGPAQCGVGQLPFHAAWPKCLHFSNALELLFWGGRLIDRHQAHGNGRFQDISR